MTLDPTRCPLCGEPNACGVAQGRSECWCFDEKIPAEVLARLPEEAKGIVCVCRACATGTQGAVTLGPELEARLPRGG